MIKLWNDPKKRNLYPHLYAAVQKKSCSCGIACLQYIMSMEKVPVVLPKKNLEWIFDLALFFLQNHSGNIKLLYNNSRIMKDYLSKKIQFNFPGCRAIQGFLSSGGNILSHKDFLGTIREMVKNNYVITLISSSVLYQNPLFNSAHYIIILDVHEDQLLILNPLHTIVVQQIIPVNLLQRGCESQGNWLLCVPKGKNLP